MSDKQYRQAVFPWSSAGLILLWLFISVARQALGAQPRSSSPQTVGMASGHVAATVPLSLQSGTPLSIAVVHRVRIGHEGEPVQGTLVQPVYSFDRIVAPAGSEVLGRITEVRSAPGKKRIEAIMQGNFTPLRSARVGFDTLVLKNGRRIPIQTHVSPATAQMVHLQVVGGQQSGKQGFISRAISNAKQQIKQEKKQVLADFEQPGRMHRIEQWLLAGLPYHRQYLPAGARFTAVVEKPVALGSAQVPASELRMVGSVPPANSLIEAVLITPLSSATARRGMPVAAMVTRPLFSKNHELIFPEGSKLEGRVVQAEPARRMRLHRNGILRFTFQKIQTPHGIPQIVEGNLRGVDVDKKERVVLDSEGGAHTTTSKMHYAEPALAVLIAATSSMPDTDIRPGRVYTDTNGPASGQILGGGMGFGLTGVVMALGVHAQPVTAGFAAYGAAWSIYSQLLSRGHDVVFPKDTPMEIRLGEHRPALPAGAANSRPPKAQSST